VTTSPSRPSDLGQLRDAARGVHLLLLQKRREDGLGEWSLARGGDDLTYRGPFGRTVAGRIAALQVFAAGVLAAGSETDRKSVAELVRWLRPGEQLRVRIEVDRFVGVELRADGRMLAGEVVYAEMRITDDLVLVPEPNPLDPDPEAMEEYVRAQDVLRHALGALRYELTRRAVAGDE
jgi:hypothetical protein